jgi:hypothetical protein
MFLLDYFSPLITRIFIFIEGFVYLFFLFFEYNILGYCCITPTATSWRQSVKKNHASTCVRNGSPQVQRSFGMNGPDDNAKKAWGVAGTVVTGTILSVIWAQEGHFNPKMALYLEPHK